VNTAEALAQGDALTWKLAASGFRDTSRVAAGSIPMMLDILVTNRNAILDALRQAQEELSALAALLETENYTALESALEAARNRRMEVYR